MNHFIPAVSTIRPATQSLHSWRPIAALLFWNEAEGMVSEFNATGIEPPPITTRMESLLTFLEYERHQLRTPEDGREKSQNGELMETNGG